MGMGFTDGGYECSECCGRGIIPAHTIGHDILDMRREVPIPELPEAACRLGLNYVSGPLVGPDLRKKFTCSGTPEAVTFFMKEWAPSNGLIDIYGDPARGFAGGYTN